MAAKSNVGQAEQAICRLVEETSEGKKLLRRDFLGPGCLAKFEDVKFLRPKPNSNFFLVASNRAVLTKSHLMVIKKPRKGGKKISVKVVAEFLGIEDRTLLERKDLSDLCRSLEKDVYELNGVTCIALTNQKESSFLCTSARSLEVYNFSEGSESSVLWNQLQCLAFRKEELGETTQQERTAAFSTQTYDLFHCDSFFEGRDSQFGNVDISTTRKRFREEDEFAKGDIPLGAIIVTKDCQLAGFWDFYNKHPGPLLFGSKFQETGETLTHTEQGSQVYASGGVSHTSYQSQLAWLQSRGLDVLDEDVTQSSLVSPSAENGLDDSGPGETLNEQQNVGSHEQGQMQNDKGQGPFPTENSCRLTDSYKQVVPYLPHKDDMFLSKVLC